MATFLSGLEQSSRLVRVHDLKLQSDIKKNSQQTKANLDFVVYVRNMDYADFAENTTSSGRSTVDTKIR